jgi:hypothetical protein
MDYITNYSDATVMNKRLAIQIVETFSEIDTSDL